MNFCIQLISQIINQCLSLFSTDLDNGEKRVGLNRERIFWLLFVSLCVAAVILVAALTLTDSTGNCKLQSNAVIKIFMGPPFYSEFQES
jgi:hypothetical protein